VASHHTQRHLVGAHRLVSARPRQPGTQRAGLTSKPHHAQRPQVALRGSFCLRLASTFNHRPARSPRPSYARSVRLLPRDVRTRRARALPGWREWRTDEPIFGSSKIAWLARKDRGRDRASGRSPRRSSNPLAARRSRRVDRCRLGRSPSANPPPVLAIPLLQEKPFPSFRRKTTGGGEPCRGAWKGPQGAVRGEWTPSRSPRKAPPNATSQRILRARCGSSQLCCACGVRLCCACGVRRFLSPAVRCFLNPCSGYMEVGPAKGRERGT
jgi:hypothetical protein